jgi:hypothetical protein
VRTDWPGVRLVEPGGNLGFAAANNLAIRQTQGELVLLLNPDTVVPAGQSGYARPRDRGRRRHRDRRSAARGRDGRPELSFGPMMSPWGELRQKALVRAHERGIRPSWTWSSG